MVKDRRLPAIVRAAGLYELSQYNSPAVLDASYELLNDFDPQVHSVAIANLQSLPDESLVRSVVPLLKDPVRSVRTEAARVLARVPASLLKGTQRQSLAQALEEFENGPSGQQRWLRPISHSDCCMTLSRISTLRQAYETAIHVEPQVSGPRTNLAALLDRLAEQAGIPGRGESGLGGGRRVPAEGCPVAARGTCPATAGCGVDADQCAAAVPIWIATVSAWSDGRSGTAPGKSLRSWSQIHPTSRWP